jgi:protein-S-isoprenylcysteine O-methyltransferase Ste14
VGHRAQGAAAYALDTEELGMTAIDSGEREHRHCPTTLAWTTKVVLGVFLVGHFAALAVFGGLLPVWWQAPYPLFLLLVIAGAGTTIGHYVAFAGRVGLITDAALFRWIRHPMYLGDLLLYLGFALYPATPVGIVAYGVAVIALVRQALREDHAMDARYGGEHVQWRGRTWLLVPGF